PGARVQPRGQYDVRQGERRRADQYRARAQSRGRTIPRASAERGISGAGRNDGWRRTKSEKSCAPRPDVRVVVAIRSGEDDAVAAPAQSRPQNCAVDL